MRDKILFIVNPISGGGKSMKAIDLIERMAKNASFEVEIKQTKQAGDGSLFAKNALEAGCKRIIAVGGDGTVNEIGKELIGSSVLLGIVPAGSGNGLARHMKIPLNLKKAIALAFEGQSEMIDTGTLNDVPFLNLCGIGMDAHVCFSFAETERRGWFNYVRLILNVSRNLPILNLTLDYDGKSETIAASMITVANSTQYGNNAIIAPNADIRDGLLDVCIMKPTGFLGALKFYFKIMTGRVKSGKDFITFPTTSISIQGTDKKAHIDGDPLLTEATVLIKTIPKSLNIISPL